MFSLSEYVRHYDRNPDNNFAVACYDQNTIDALEEAARRPADETDIETWDLESGQEWQDAISAALWERMQPRVDAINALIAAMGLAGDVLAWYVVSHGIALGNEASTHMFPSEVETEEVRAYLHTL